ncbi:hypothetical protein [Cupriavidus oxalaticus]|uniref:hypothetical protein n=1 Tax=Cupriavidus TaxID=106589 RepID=UPI00197A8BED|nr:hypothetical protein [Cupriavidus oxalaticus]
MPNYPRNRPEALANASLGDKYPLEKGCVYLSGAQTLVRLPVLRRTRQRRMALLAQYRSNAQRAAA